MMAGFDEPDLRVDAVPRLVVGSEQFWANSGRQVSLDARLLTPDEAGHFSVCSSR